MYSETSYLYYWGMNFAPIELAEAARYGTFITYFFLILTPVNHLLEFQYSRYANYSLIMQKYQKHGAVGTRGTSTALIGTGTDSVLEGGIGTVLLLH